MCSGPSWPDGKCSGTCSSDAPADIISYATLRARSLRAVVGELLPLFAAIGEILALHLCFVARREQQFAHTLDEFAFVLG